MTIPTGQGQKCGLDAADGPGTPEPFRPARAAANDAKYGGMSLSSPPGDDSDDAVVDMKRNPYVGNVSQGGD
jgi:hypothetical protein